MRVVEVSVKNLFGVFNHDIPLKTDDRVTIIHGPNGFGKTILLRMLAGLFSGRYSELRDVPFNEFRIRFEDGSTVWVEKTTRPVPTQATLPELENGRDRRVGRRAEPAPLITVNFVAANSVESNSFTLGAVREDIDIPMSRLASGVETMIPGMERVGSMEWIYEPTGEELSLREILDRFGHLFPFEALSPPEWWTEIQESIDIRLIESQRLTSILPSDRARRRSRMVPAVEGYSEELAQTIQRKLAESAALSQSLDRTFPARLVDQMGRSELTEDQLRDKLSALEKERSRLEEVGLLDREEEMALLPRGELSGSAKQVLEVYVQDVERKLSIFDEMADKIELFKQIIADRFMYKRIAISKHDGFSFTTPDGESLPLRALSSGEQHELVLLYQLLFKANPNSLILIDEPELSLHIAWQKQFLRDLQEIARLASLDVLIATHSPQIIHNRWDLAVELKGP